MESLSRHLSSEISCRNNKTVTDSTPNRVENMATVPLTHLMGGDSFLACPPVDKVTIFLYCKAQVQVLSTESKVQRKENETGDDNIILQATTNHHHPTPLTYNFSHLKCQSNIFGGCD